MRHVDVTPRTRIGRVICFVVVALAFSWLHWFAVIASQRGWLSVRWSVNPAAIFGPLIAVVAVLIVASDDRKRWATSLLQWRIPPVVGLGGALLCPLTLACCIAAATAITPGAPRVQIPPLATIVSMSVGMFLTAGVGEESGWRGLLLPELRRSFGSVLASSIVAVVWFVWHLPLFWVIGATQQEIPVAVFALGILSYSFILTWLVEQSNHSTLAAMLFHCSANVSFWFAVVYVKNLPQFRLAAIAYLFTIAIFGAVAVVSLIGRDRKSAHPVTIAG